MIDSFFKDLRTVTSFDGVCAKIDQEYHSVRASLEELGFKFCNNTRDYGNLMETKYFDTQYERLFKYYEDLLCLYKGVIKKRWIGSTVDSEEHRKQYIKEQADNIKENLEA